MRVAALVLAAGRGERLGYPLIPKAFVPLGGVPLLLHSLRALEAVPQIESIIPVLPAGEAKRFEELGDELLKMTKLLPPVIGGQERQDSMRAGLAALPPGTELVAVHDAARPFVRAADISVAIAKARETGAAILAMPVRDTLKRVEAERIVDTPDRESMFAAQTPQIFRVDWLREAVEGASEQGFAATDDAQLVERLGREVSIVSGSFDNFKITVPLDLMLGEALLAQGRKPEGKEPAK